MKKVFKIIIPIALLLLIIVAAVAHSEFQSGQIYKCIYCGKTGPISSFNDYCKGNSTTQHNLQEISSNNNSYQQKTYTCKYCGRTASSISSLTSSKCSKRQSGNCVPY